MDQIYGQTSGREEIIKNFVEQYFVPYIKSVNNYGMITFKNIGYENIYYLNRNLDNGINSQRYILSLTNGSIIAISLDSGCDGQVTDDGENATCEGGSYYTYIYIITDINGLQNPNTYGKDIFVMSMKSNKFGFYTYGSNRTGLLSYCNKNSGYESRHCGRLIQYDGWQIKNDYPW